MPLNKQWSLPSAPNPLTREWNQVVRIGVHIPFGYKQNDNDPDILDPIPEELELLEKAKKLLKKYSLREVANWLTQQSGRSISYEGLRKRIKIERKRKQDIANAEFYAKRAKEAAEKAEAIKGRIGGVTPDLDSG